AAKAIRKPAPEKDDAVAALLEPDEPAPPRSAQDKAKREIEVVEEVDDSAFAIQAEPRPPGSPHEEEREGLLHGTEDEDDRNPYRVLGDAASKKCPECNKKVAKRAAVCTHCGYHFEAGRKVERTYQPFNREWENFFSLHRRIMFFVVLQVINMVAFVAV